MKGAGWAAGGRGPPSREAVKGSHCPSPAAPLSPRVAGVGTSLPLEAVGPGLLVCV